MGFLRNTWYAAMWSEGLSEGQLAPRTIINQPLVYYRRQDGGVAALTDLCPHKFAPLHLGKLVGNDVVRCGYHGLEFDSSGACVRNPHGHERIPSACKVKTFQAVEKHSLVWVWMGDEPGDPATIPDYSFMDEGSGYDITRRDFIRMESNYRLVADNLMDLSHSPYLHDGVIGNSDTVKADIRVVQDGNKVVVHRDKFDVRPTGLLDRLYKRDGAKVDIWSAISWTPPCYILNNTGAYPPGGDRREGAGLFGAHLLTPETEHSTMYHFAASRQGVIVDKNEDQVELRRWFSEARRHAFEDQDEPMIKAQQDMMKRFPELVTRPVYLETDAGPLRCNRILDSMISAEQG